jgi:hypothetical protein
VPAPLPAGGRLVRSLLWTLPLWLGRRVQRLGLKLDEMGTWLVGLAALAIIVVLVLNFAGAAVATGDPFEAIRRAQAALEAAGKPPAPPPTPALPITPTP